MFKNGYELYCTMKKKAKTQSKTKTNKAQTVVLERFSQRFKALRKAKGYTNQEYFAYDNEFSRVQVGKWERGGDIKLSSVARVCDALGITMKEFFSEGFD